MARTTETLHLPPETPRADAPADGPSGRPRLPVPLTAAAAAFAIAVGLLLYLLGLRWPLLVALVAVDAAYLWMPRVLVSWAARAVGAGVFVFGLAQVAATAQYFVARQSDFRVLAALLVAANALLLLVAGRERVGARPAVHVHDLWALLPGLVFLAPFAVFFRHAGGVTSGIAAIAGTQVVDATTHYAMVALQTYLQHFNYAHGVSYYPNGFHIAAGFFEQAVFENLHSLGWQGNVRLYFGQYALLGVMAGAAFYHVTATLVARLRGLAVLDGWSGLLAALGVAPVLGLFYLVPFVYHGFLNYTYVVLTLAFGIAYLLEVRDVDDVEAPITPWPVTAYLVLAFGASASWPLLTPALLLVGAALFLVQARGWIAATWRRQALAVAACAAAALLNLVPVYLQLAYSPQGAVNEFNTPGNLVGLHSLLLVAGAAAAAVLAARARHPASIRHALLGVVVPLLGFVTLLALFQYLQTGEIRYYAVKVSIPVQMLAACLVVALLWTLVDALPRPGLGAAALALLPALAIGLLLTAETNPLGDARSLFRDYSHVAKPPMYDQDLARLVALGRAGKLDHVNATALHVNQAGILYQHEQLPFWADLMSYDATSYSDQVDWICVGDLYPMLAYGDIGAPANQQAVVAQVRKCADLARAQGRTFYIVTDPASGARLRPLFGDVATLVY